MIKRRDISIIFSFNPTYNFKARFAECWKIELAGMNFIYNITGMNAESNML